MPEESKTKIFLVYRANKIVSTDFQWFLKYTWLPPLNSNRFPYIREPGFQNGGNIFLYEQMCFRTFHQKLEINEVLMIQYTVPRPQARHNMLQPVRARGLKKSRQPLPPDNLLRLSLWSSAKSQRSFARGRITCWNVPSKRKSLRLRCAAKPISFPHPWNIR